MSIVAVHAAAGQVTFSGRRPTVPKGTAASPDSRDLRGSRTIDGSVRKTTPDRASGSVAKVGRAP
jgi:hypothetical protein